MGLCISVAMLSRLRSKREFARHCDGTVILTTRSDFQDYQSFRTHDLNVLLKLSGIESEIRTRFLIEWSAVAVWDPEMRYKPIGSATQQDAKSMIKSTKVLLRML